MGTTAEKIARSVAAKAKAPIIDLAGHRSARQHINDAKLERERFEQQIADGLDPCFAVYAHAQALVSMTAEYLASTKEARQFTRIVADAEDTYMPSFPPMSPVTTTAHDRLRRHKRMATAWPPRPPAAITPNRNAEIAPSISLSAVLKP